MASTDTRDGPMNRNAGDHDTREAYWQGEITRSDAERRAVTVDARPPSAEPVRRMGRNDGLRAPGGPGAPRDGR